MPEVSALLQATAVVEALPAARGVNSASTALGDLVDARLNYVRTTNLTTSYAMAIIFGTSTTMAIPSQAISAISSRIEPSFSSLAAVDLVNDAKAAFAAADIGQTGIIDPSHDIWETVEAYARRSLNATATDTLLDYVVACLDNENFRNLDSLISLMAQRTLHSNEDVGPHGLARVINVLGLTFRHAQKLTHRAALRSAYRDTVAKTEGPASADQAIAHL